MKKSHEKEKAVCEICGKEFLRSSAYREEKKRKVCGGKCRLIDWAERAKKEIAR
jgi:endogenous inhibitor of DNA gyrase (YacG/DUF329 family)